MPVVDARVIVLWAQGGQPLINTVDARYDDAVTSVQGAADVIRDAFQTNVLSLITTNCVLDEVKVGDDVSGAVAPSGQAGTANSDSLPISSSWGVTKVVGTGRNGRWFLPGIAETFVNGVGRLSVAAVTQMNAAMVLFLAECEAGGVDLRVKQKDGSYAQIDTFSVRPFITLQSRRLDRARGF